jgi:hypothetical protein
LPLNGVRSARGVVAAWLLVFAVGWLTLMSVRVTTGATDIAVYFSYGEAMRHGHLPYRDFAVEYPPFSLVAFGLPAVASSGLRGYRIAFELLMGLCGAGIIMASAFAVVRLGERLVAPLGFITAAFLALGPLALGHFDLLPAFLVSAGLACLVWDRRTGSAILIGLAIAAKIYGFVLVPLAVVWIWRSRGGRAALIWLGTAAATVVVCFLPFLIAAPVPVLSSLYGQAGRPVQLESSAAGALLALHQLVGLKVGIGFSHSSANLGGTTAAAAAALSVLAEVGLILFLWIAFARRRGDLQQLINGSMGAVLAFVTLGKVFSPQFLLWLIPLASLLGGTLALGGWLALGLAVVLTRLYFPGRWIGVIHLEALPTWLLVARNLALLMLLAAVVLAFIRRPTATSPIPPRTPQAGSN